MSERYTRLYSLTENLYTEGAPVVIAAGALLKDTQTGHVLAQLKLQNIQEKRIKAVTVKLLPYDAANRPIDDIVIYQYLDLNVQRDEEFGQKNPLRFSSDIVRSFEATVTEVVFADGGLWQCGSEAKWEPLTAPVSLEEHFGDEEMAEQYRLTFGEGCCCFPTKDRDLWRCACGEVNRGNEAKCHSCGAEYSWLTEFDLAKLAAERDARVEAERIAAEEAAAKAAAEAKRAKEAAAARAKKLKIAATVSSILIVIGSLTTWIISDYLHKDELYNEAVLHLNDKKYDSAINILSELNGFRDSEELLIDTQNLIAEIRENIYTAVVENVENGKYNEAISIYDSNTGTSTTKNYKDIKNYVYYAQALKLIEHDTFLGYDDVCDIVEQLDALPTDFLDVKTVKAHYLQFILDNLEYVKTTFSDIKTTFSDNKIQLRYEFEFLSYGTVSYVYYIGDSLILDSHTFYNSYYKIVDGKIAEIWLFDKEYFDGERLATLQQKPNSLTPSYIYSNFSISNNKVTTFNLKASFGTDAYKEYVSGTYTLNK